jgi:hypothetical protein
LALRSDSGEDVTLEPSNAFTELSGICWKLDIPAAFTMRCEAVDHFIQKLQNDPTQTEITLHPHHMTIPVVDSLHELATFDTSVRRRDYACFVREEAVLLVWSQTSDELLIHAGEMEDKLVASVSPKAAEVARPQLTSV